MGCRRGAKIVSKKRRVRKLYKGTRVSWADRRQTMRRVERRKEREEGAIG